jgi:hypothetical protein
MSVKIPKATYPGEIKLGDSIIQCAVLEGGTRVLTQEGFLKTLGRAGKAKGGHGASVAQIPAFLSAKNLEPFISSELLESTKPIRFKTQSGTLGYGYKAELLPRVCQVYLEARDAQALKPSQHRIAAKADILIRALAHIGIIALIDEATGYQYDRDKADLDRLLALYLSEERLKWAKTFPDEYYRQLFRLKNWKYSPVSVKRPKLVGKLTNKYVYEMLPPEVLEKLRKLNPVKNRDTWRREATHFQHLSPEIGQKDLRDHILQLVAVMRVSSNWRDFQRNFARAFQVAPEQMEWIEEED